MSPEQPETTQVVDVEWPLLASPPGYIPVDHGYALFASLSRIVPDIHETPTLGVHPIRGQLVGNREMRIGPGSHLVIRLPASLVPMALPFSGANIQVERCPLIIGVPSTRGLIPAPTLTSRLVTIKHATTAESFLAAAKEQLATLGIAASPSIPARRTDATYPIGGGRDVLVRRTIRIAGKEVVGYALVVEGLSPLDSIRLQERGIGGRRHFGCGVFVPSRSSQ